MWKYVEKVTLVDLARRRAAQVKVRLRFEFEAVARWSLPGRHAIKSVLLSLSRLSVVVSCQQLIFVTLLRFLLWSWFNLGSHRKRIRQCIYNAGTYFMEHIL